MTDPTQHTVLVVDDAPDALSLIHDTLEQAGMNTLVALEGRQALAIVRRIRPDIVLLDALMPGMDGFETCRRLKEDPRLAATPVLFMTGLSDTDSILKGLDAGGVDYLTKPVNPSELLARMRVHLKTANLAESAQRALDSTGHNTFTVTMDGRILWATPDTLALFARLDADEAWRAATLAPAIATWLRDDPAPGATLALPTANLPAVDGEHAINLLESHAGGERLLCITKQDRMPAEQKLQRALHLTTRESEVLYWLANGKSNKDIALILGMGARTVNKHLEQIFPKLGVENRTAAAGIAIRTLA